MTITNVMLSAGLIVISFSISFLVFYIYSDLPRIDKTTLIQESVSQLINLIFLVWIIKIIFNFNLFIKAPLTVLAYPSNSYAFYTAIIIFSVIFMYKSRKHSNASEFIESFTIILLIASMIYELFNFIWNNNASSFGHLLLLASIFFIFLLLQKRIQLKKLLIMSSFLWSVGILILLNFYPVITIFNYIIRPWFLPIFFVLSVLVVFLTTRKDGNS